MRKKTRLRSGRERPVLLVVGWLLAIAVGICLIWAGFALDKRLRQSAAPQSPTAAPTVASPLPSPTPVYTPFVAYTPYPTATPIPPTPTPTATLVPATIVAGADGANVRSGPGTDYPRLGYLEPGVQAKLIGRYADWWQIEYNGAPAWVFSGVVTASNADDVPEVQPPPPP